MSRWDRRGSQPRYVHVEPNIEDALVKTLIAAVVGFFVSLVFVFLALSILLDGFVLKFLWSWFVTDKFGLQELSIPEAIGLSLIGNLVATQYIPLPKGEKPGFGMLVSSIVRPLFLLGAGWIVQLFL